MAQIEQLPKFVYVYTSKLEATVEHKTAKVSIVLSATRGTVEDVHEAMQKVVDTLRAAFEVSA